MAGHAQLKFVMTECSKTQIRLTGFRWKYPELVKIAQNLVGYARKWLGDMGLKNPLVQGGNPIEQEVPYTKMFGMA